MRVEFGGYSDETSPRFTVTGGKEFVLLTVADLDEAGVDQEGEVLLTKLFDHLQVLLAEEVFLRWRHESD